MTAGAPDLHLDFVPVSAPLTRGIFVSSFVTLEASVDEASIASAYETAFASARFVRVPKGRLPEVVAVSGSAYVEVGYTLGPAHGASQDELIDRFDLPVALMQDAEALERISAELVESKIRGQMPDLGSLGLPGL